MQDVGAAHGRDRAHGVLLQLDWQYSRVLDVRQNDARIHFLNAGQLRQLFEEEPFVRLDVFGHDA